MTCPTCKCKETTVRRTTGYSSCVIHECIECETIFLLEERKKPKILYLRER
jgi:hypothetical protein